MGYPSSFAHLRRYATHLGLLAIPAGLIVAAACAKGGTGNGNGFGGSGGSGGDGEPDGGGPVLDSGTPIIPPIMGSTCTSSAPCADFPSGPVADMASTTPVPQNAPTLFSGTPSTSGGPCLYEPADGTLFPNGG